MLVNAYRDHAAGLSIGEALTAFDNANAHIGVGDSSTAAAATQTDLQGANKFRRPMESGFPNRSQGNNIMRFKSSFGTAEANYAWQEWGVFNAVSAGVMMNRKVESLGTKTNTQTWELTVDVQLNLA